MKWFWDATDTVLGDFVGEHRAAELIVRDRQVGEFTPCSSYSGGVLLLPIWGNG